MSSKKRILFKYTLALLALFAVERFCKWQTAGFRLDKLRSDFVFKPTYPQVEDPLLATHLKQRFTFLGSGVQCYAFLGEDQKTVLKVFKHYHNVPVKGFLKSMPLPPLLERWRASVEARRERRLNAIFSSCELANHALKSEAALLGAHLEPTTNLSQKITLIDKLGIAYGIDADTTAFVLQKRVEMLPEKIEALAKQNKQEEMRACLKSLVQLIAKRCKSGILNLDLRIDRNIGFSGLSAVEIDVGSFKKLETLQPYRSEVKRELKKLREWVEESYPELLDDVKHEIEMATATL